MFCTTYNYIVLYWLQILLVSNINSFLLQKLQYDARLSGDNHLLEQIIDILGHLVRFGYYDNHEDIDQSIAPLIQLLDGHTDVQSITNRDGKLMEDCIM